MYKRQGGWTAGNLVASPADVARFAHALYRPGGAVVSAARRAEMLDFGPHAFYGMGTFNLNWTTGSHAAYGHVGDTYGYQSAVTYFADLDGTLAVGTNGETTSQAQPSDATCRVYQALRARAKGAPPPQCRFESQGHFFGRCACQR